MSGKAPPPTEHYTLGNSQQSLQDAIILFLEQFSANVLPFPMKAHLPCLTGSF